MAIDWPQKYIKSNFDRPADFVSHPFWVEIVRCIVMMFLLIYSAVRFSVSVSVGPFGVATIPSHSWSLIIFFSLLSVRRSNKGSVPCHGSAAREKVQKWNVMDEMWSIVGWIACVGNGDFPRGETEVDTLRAQNKPWTIRTRLLHGNKRNIFHSAGENIHALRLFLQVEGDGELLTYRKLSIPIVNELFDLVYDCMDLRNKGKIFITVKSGDEIW